MVMNKKADTEPHSEIINENIIWLIFLIIFFFCIGFFLYSKGNDVSFKEQMYAKEIGLMINKAVPGTKIQMKMPELIDFANQKVDYSKIIKIDNENNFIQINLIPGKGYRYQFFNDCQIIWSFNEKGDLEFTFA